MNSKVRANTLLQAEDDRSNVSTLPVLVHTPKHVGCEACAQAKAGIMGLKLIAIKEFSEAAASWLNVHQKYINEETLLDYQKCLKPLTEFFQGMMLKDIDIGNLRCYQESRARIQRVNKECTVFRMILHEAGLWQKKFSPWYKPIPIKKSSKGRRLTWDEEDRLKRVVLNAIAEDRKQWALAGSCLLVMSNIAFGFKELKYLRRKDVDMDGRMVTLEVKAKNTARYRTVPMNQTAYDAMTYLIERWNRIGGSDDNGFLLPHRAHVAGAKWDFSTPMGSIKNANKKIMAAARIKDFRIYDCRHHAQSKWLTNPKIAPQVADEMAGHISAAMRKRYCHVLMEQMRAAVDAMETPKKHAESEGLRVIHRGAKENA